MGGDSVSARAPTAGWRALWAAGGGRLAVVCFGVWLHAADELITATLVPSVVRDIGGAELIAWTLALYEIGSIAAGAASALASLRLGLRRALIGAALVYAGGCALSAVAPSMPVVLAGRLLQGAGGGGMVALAFVAATRFFPGPLMPRAMAAISVVWGASSFMGPMVGGFFAEIGFWRGGFWCMGAQAVLLAVWIGLGFDAGAREPAGEERPPPFPLLRLGALAAGVVLIAAAGIDAAPARSGLLALAGLSMLALFFRLDAGKGADRLLPTPALSFAPGVGAGLLMVLCLSAASVVVAVYGPLLMTTLYGVSAFVAGGVLALGSIGWSLAAVAFSGAAERHDRRLILTGMGLVSLSVVGFVVAAPQGSVGWIALFAGLEGAGFGLAWTFILRRLDRLAPAEDRERVSSAAPTMQRLGYATGAAWCGIVASAAGVADDMAVETARAVGFWVFAGALPVAALGLIAAWIFAGRDAES